MPIAKFGSDDQKERFLRPMATGQMLCAFALTEAHGGSDAGALSTRALRDGDDYSPAARAVLREGGALPGLAP